MRVDRGAWALALGFFGLCMQSSDARAYCRLTTDMPVAGAACATSGLPLYWPRSCISYSIVAREHSDDPPLNDIRDVVDESFATWLEVSCNGDALGLGLGLAQTDELSTCNVPTYSEDEPNANSIMFLTDWQERGLPNEAFGLTLVWHDSRTGEILDADVQLNETLGALGICQDAQCDPGEVDLQNIMTHEAGHFLGLGHAENRDACMYGKAEVGDTNKRFLSRDDEDGLCAIYAGLAATSCSADDYLPTNGLGSTCDPVPVASNDDAGTGYVPRPGRTKTICSVAHAADGGSRSAAWSVGAALLLLGARLRRRRGAMRA